MFSRLELLSYNTVVQFALQTAFGFVDGEVKQMLFAWVLTFAQMQNDLRGCKFPFGSKAELTNGPATAAGLRQHVSVKPEGDLPVAEVPRGLPSQHTVKHLSLFQAGLTQTGQERAINH